MLAGATLTQWIAFHLLLAVLLAADAIVAGREPSTRRSLVLTICWVAAAVTFGLVYLRPVFGHAATLEYLTGYAIEQSLSLDNLFVFLLLLRTFSVPPAAQRKVLFYGIFGAVLMRGAFIFGGIALIDRFAWVQYIFAAVLLFAAIRLLTHSSDKEREAELHAKPELPQWARSLQKLFPAARYRSAIKREQFVVNTKRGPEPTQLFLAIIAVELTDILFALDSVPAVLAVTHKPYIAYTSNLFAVMGLRSLYFVLAGLLARFKHLHYGLAVLLGFIAAKILAAKWITLSTPVSLGVILAILGVTIVFSLLTAEKKPAASADASREIS